eukprot:scaffold500_cov210-Chaetoceros_neogracile.AAC.6
MGGRNERTITVVRYNQKSVVGRTVQYSAMWCGRHILTPLLDSGLSTLDSSRQLDTSLLLHDDGRSQITE